MLLVSEAQQHTAEEVIRGLREMWRGNINDKKMLFFAPPQTQHAKKICKAVKSVYHRFPLFRHSFFSTGIFLAPMAWHLLALQSRYRSKPLRTNSFHLIPNRDAQSTGCHFRIMKIISLGFLPSSPGHLNASTMQNDNNDGLLEEVRFHFSCFDFQQSPPNPRLRR